LQKGKTLRIFPFERHFPGKSSILNGQKEITSRFLPFAARALHPCTINHPYTLDVLTADIVLGMAFLRTKRLI